MHTTQIKTVTEEFLIHTSQYSLGGATFAPFIINHTIIDREFRSNKYSLDPKIAEGIIMTSRQKVLYFVYYLVNIVNKQLIFVLFFS